MAAKRNYPLYHLVGFIGISFGMMILMIGLGSLGLGMAGDVIALFVFFPLITLFMMVGWLGSGVAIYWDSKAGEKYLQKKFRLGKLFALLGFVFGPAIIVAYLVLYRRFML